MSIDNCTPQSQCRCHWRSRLRIWSPLHKTEPLRRSPRYQYRGNGWPPYPRWYSPHCISCDLSHDLYKCLDSHVSYNTGVFPSLIVCYYTMTVMWTGIVEITLSCLLCSKRRGGVLEQGYMVDELQPHQIKAAIPQTLTPLMQAMELLFLEWVYLQWHIRSDYPAVGLHFFEFFWSDEPQTTNVIFFPSIVELLEPGNFWVLHCHYDLQRSEVRVHSIARGLTNMWFHANHLAPSR